MTQSEFEAFHAETAHQLYAYLLRICNTRDTAEDILQECYLLFLQKPPESKNFVSMKSYLYTIATRLNLDRLKSARYKRVMSLSLLGRSWEQPDKRKTDTALQIDVNFVLRLLKPKERALIWLALVEEQPHESIADILGLRKKSVKVLLFRARQKFANLLKKYDLNEGLINE